MRALFERGCIQIISGWCAGLFTSKEQIMSLGAAGASDGGKSVAMAMRGNLAAGMTSDTTGPSGGTPASFSGSGSAFAGILVRGVFLQLLTFGFYRFWLITNIRRHLWGNTRIGGESLEYTGTAKELLIGFLIALAILVPVYILYFLAGLVAETMQAFASIPLILVLYCLGYYAAFRARRYRATRTLFRGVRFWMTGSGWSYLGRAALWDLATILTLGLAYPWRKAALERYLMRNTRYGTLKGDFVGTGWSLFRQLASVWGPIFIVIACLAVFAIGADAVLDGFHSTPLRMVAIALGACIPFAIAYSIAVVMRWRLNAIRIGEARLVSELPLTVVVKCSLLFLLTLFAFTAIVGIIAGIAVMTGAVALRMQDIGGASIIVVVAVGLFYIWTLLSIGALKRYFIERGLWRAAAGTAAVTNLASIEEAGAAGKPASGLGEGLADALDMGF
jgi:uncharacterized membrane protein YjgN (DUF898 family)